jgi:tripeptide aminopeptidase
MVNRERIVNEFLKYIGIDSLTKAEGEFAGFISEELVDLGAEVYIDNAGEQVGSDTGNVIAKFKGTIDRQPIMFSSHMDTVSPGKGIKPVIRDNIIYSDGTTILGGDDKAGIAAVIEAIRCLQENNIEHGPIEIVFSIAEEGGLLGAKNLDYSKIESKLAFVLDSSGSPGQIVIKGPAQDKIDVKIIGKPAHAGVSPEEGISAIQVAASAISRMKLLRIDEETTANIGSINGGIATNIVCPEIIIKAEARSLNSGKLDAQTVHMIACFKQAAEEFGAKLEVETSRSYSELVIDENDEIVNIVRKACENVGLKASTVSTGGGSDTNVLNGKGIKSVNLGIGAKKPHTLEEYLRIEDLVNISGIVIEIIKTV